jgi:lactoylglutathione lyase
MDLLIILYLGMAMKQALKFLMVSVCLMMVQEGQAQNSKHKARINHTAIYVMNIAKSGNFYSNRIGLDTVAEPFHDGKHIWYKTAEHTMLHVIEGALTKREYYKNQHTCFTVPHFERFVQNLLKDQWPFEDVAGNKNKITTRVDGVHQIWLQDPDGYWIEINDDPF